MRPKKIVLQAFGPYLDKNVVDFTEFQSNDIFLITGTTGSGKTSIFDALSFALYGKPSGNIRDVDMLRNISADANTETFVEFTFDYHEREYKILRKPRYMRAKKSGEGLTESIADAQLTLPSGEVISGLKQVNEKIQEILKIDQNQFAQIVMIAQNDFLKFLQSNTSDRKNILRTIFNTEFYSLFESELKLKTQIEKETYERLQLEYTQQLKLLRDETLSEESSFNHDVIISTLDSTIKKNQEKINVLNQKIKEDDLNLQKHTQEYTLASTTNKIIESYTKYQKEYQSLLKEKESIDTLKLRLNKLKLTEKNIHPLNRDLNRIQETIQKNEEDLKSLSQKREQLDERMKQLEYKKTVKGKNESRLNELSKQLIYLESLNAKFLERNTLDKELKHLSQESSKTEEKLILALSIENHKIESLQDTYDKSMIDYQRQKDNFETLRKQYLDLEVQFLKSQAGILAKDLEDDKPCPVCGSIHHPKPAILTVEDLEETYFRNKQSLERDEHNLQSDLKILEESAEKLKQLKADFDYYFKRHFKGDNQRDILKEVKDDLTINMEEVSNKVQELKEELKEKQIVLHKLSEELPFDSLESYEQKLKLLYREKENLEMYQKDVLKEEQDLNNLKIEIDTEYITKTKSLDNHLKDLKEKELIFKDEVLKVFSTLNDYEKEVKDINLIDAYETKISDYTSKLLKMESLVNDYKQQVLDKEFIDTDRLKQIIDSLKEDIKISNDELTTLKQDNKMIISVKEELIIIYTKLQKQELIYSDTLSLSQTASGALSGKEKIQFETYAQMAYFERIIFFANQRLKVMSNHQYELLRRDKASNMQSQGGLDLDIFDHYHGSRREVGSLSGGELFNTSLALALGLSDVIQHVSGGIKIDALFIDEGFGSLSDEYLENAIQTLSEVAGGDRMIGVISHVKELKDAITNQIVITKDEKGSHIQIHKE